MPEGVTVELRRSPKYDAAVDPEDQRWQEDANCRGEDPELFMPKRGVPITSARRICEECVVRIDCLEYALANYNYDTDHGVWGGKSQQERKKIRRERAIARQATPS